MMTAIAHGVRVGGKTGLPVLRSRIPCPESAPDPGSRTPRHDVSSRRCRQSTAGSPAPVRATLMRSALILAATVAASAGTGGSRASDMSGGLLPVPAKTVSRGESITPEKLTEKHFYYDPDRPLSVLTDPREAVGRAARRTLIAGKPIPFDAIRDIVLVARGKPTRARFEIGGLTITTTVIPQVDAGPGAAVRARNPESGRMISGVVADDGTIEVAPR